MLLSLCEEIMEKAGNLPGLSTEGGPDYPDYPGIEPEKMVKIWKLPAALLAVALGITSMLSWEYFVLTSVKKATERSAKLTIIERGFNHIIPHMYWFIDVIKGFNHLFEMSDFAPWLSFASLAKLVPVFKTQFLFAHTKKTRNLSSHIYIPRSFRNIIFSIFLLFVAFYNEWEGRCGIQYNKNLKFCFTTFIFIFHWFHYSLVSLKQCFSPWLWLNLEHFSMGKEIAIHILNWCNIDKDVWKIIYSSNGRFFLVLWVGRGKNWKLKKLKLSYFNLSCYQKCYQLLNWHLAFDILSYLLLSWIRLIWSL